MSATTPGTSHDAADDTGSTAAGQSSVVADLEARADVVQHEIDDAEERIHPPQHRTFADPNVDDAAFALDGAMPKDDEVRRAQQLHEETASGPVAETKARVAAQDRESELAAPTLDPADLDAVAEHYEEMTEIGVNDPGEGQILGVHKSS